MTPSSTDGQWADSNGRRNEDCFHLWQQLVKLLCRRFPAERLSRSGIEDGCHGSDRLGAVNAQVGAFWKVLTQQPVGVLIRTALPWALRITEVDLDTSLDPKSIVLGHFGA